MSLAGLGGSTVVHSASGRSAAEPETQEALHMGRTGSDAQVGGGAGELRWFGARLLAGLDDDSAAVHDVDVQVVPV